MRALIQRVKCASVMIGGKSVSDISSGLLVFLGVGTDDTFRDVDWLAEKVANLRIFDDCNGRMNVSVLDQGGQILVVSQFTLFGDCKKGRRPSYSQAMLPEAANQYYEQFVSKLKQTGIMVKTGVFQEKMVVKIENDGPVTLFLDTKL